MYDMNVDRIASQLGISYEEATELRWQRQEVAMERADARHAAAESARQELAAQSAGQPITEKTAKAVQRKISRANKIVRAQIRNVVDNQNLFNPTIQDKHIAALTEEQGLRILGKI